MIGTVFKNTYTLQNEIGRGACGSVYVCTHASRFTPAAIRVLPAPGERGFIDQFLHHASDASRVRHPNICPVVDSGLEHNTLFVAMPLAEGRTLRQYIREAGPLAPAHAAVIIAKLASALDYIHNQKLLHRNINSDNVYIAPGGEPILMDFGVLRPGWNVPLTDEALSAMDYLCPDAAGAAGYTAAAEVYMLGLLAYEILAGRTPYLGLTVEQKREQLGRALPPPGRVRTGIPPGMEQAVMRAFAGNPQYRPASAGAFAAAFCEGFAAPPAPDMDSLVSGDPFLWFQQSAVVADLSPVEPQAAMRFCDMHPESMAVSFCISCGRALCPGCEQLVESRPYCRPCLSQDKKQQIFDTVSRLRPSEEAVESARDAVKGTLLNKELRRIAAAFIDLLVVLIASVPLMVVFWAASMPLLREVHGLSMKVSYYLSLILLGAVYYIVCHYKWGRTLGKHFLGIEAVRMDGRPLTAGGAFWRWVGIQTALIWAFMGWWLAKLIVNFVIFAEKQGAPVSNTLSLGAFIGAGLLGLVFSLGVLITFIGKHKRGFHDILAGSRVRYQQDFERRIRGESQPRKIPGPFDQQAGAS